MQKKPQECSTSLAKQSPQRTIAAFCIAFTPSCVPGFVLLCRKHHGDNSCRMLLWLHELPCACTPPQQWHMPQDTAMISRQRISMTHTGKPCCTRCDQCPALRPERPPAPRRAPCGDKAKTCGAKNRFDAPDAPDAPDARARPAAGSLRRRAPAGLPSFSQLYRFVVCRQATR